MNLEQLKIFDRISFVEETHSYLIDETPASSLSVTRAIKQFKKAFEADQIAARMAVKMGTTAEQIKEDWVRNRDCAALTGTLLHRYIEEHYTKVAKQFDSTTASANLGHAEKRKIKENLPILINQFHNFYKEHPHLKCIKSEFVVGDLEDTKICGTLDMLVYNEQTDQLEILDFKTNKKMQRHTTFGNLFYPFDNMSEGEINEYTIQLNTYKFFIEKYTSLKIGAMKLVWFNIKNENYQVFELDDIQEQIKEMFKRIKADSLFQDKILTK